MGLLFTLVLLFSTLLVHEAGHWAVLRRYRVSVDEFSIGLGPKIGQIGWLSIRLLPIGASVTLNPAQFDALGPMQRFWAVLAGPWVSALYGCLLMLFSHELTGHQAQSLFALGAINWFIAGINLLPLPPLDGFRAAVALLELRGKKLTPRMWSAANRIGNGILYASAGLLLGTGITEWMSR